MNSTPPPQETFPEPPPPKRQRRRGYIRLLMVVGVVLVAVWYAFLRPTPTWAIYEGKSSEEWFYGENQHCGRADTIENAQHAFQEMGTNCLPFLYRNLCRKESLLNRFYVYLHPKFPASLKTKARPPLALSYVQMVTVHHLGLLARDQAFDPEELMRIMRGSPDPELRRSILRVVDRLVTNLTIEGGGEDPRQFVPFYLDLLDDSFFPVQFQAAVRLSQLDPSLTNGIPWLLIATTNRTLMVEHYPQPSNVLSLGVGRQTSDQALIQQWRAHDALSVVSPELAKAHPVVEPDVASEE